MQQSDSGSTVSVWMRSGDVPRFAPLAADATCDVCVVGAGISGLTAAYLLAKEGKRVILLDDGFVGGGETQRTTAHLASYQDDGLVEIEKTFGAEGARTAAASQQAAVDMIERIVREEHIDCEFARVDGWLFNARGHPEKELDEELEAARRAGLDVDKHPRAPITTFDTGPALRVAHQGQLDITKYMAGLANAFVRLGGTIHDGTHVDEIQDGAPCTVKAKGHTVRATDVIVATNSPVNDWVTIHSKQAPYRTYVIAAPVKAGTVQPGLYWDTADPYHYVRLQHGPHGSGDDMLIVGGEDHKTGQADDMDDRWRCLEEWTRLRFELTGDVAFRWSGQVLEPSDYMGYLGRNPGNEHVYIITGDSGQGTTNGTVGAIINRDLILGRENPWAWLYDPSRKPVESATTVLDYAMENANVALQFRDYLTPGDVDDLAKVERGQGALLRKGPHKVAAYRADDGSVTLCSAVCPHMKCIVDWNPAEKSWDCPCHGSRFTATGQVLNGPANTDLTRLDPNG